jgi:hypothetical protein
LIEYAQGSSRASAQLIGICLRPGIAVALQKIGFGAYGAAEPSMVDLPA